MRSAIDELTANDSQHITSSGDVQNMDRIIVDKIGDALIHIYEEAPLGKLTDVFDKLSAQEVSLFSLDSDTLVAKITLPDNFLRFVSARLSSWSHYPIPEDATSPVAMMQQDQYAKGSWDRPVIIMSVSNKNRYLEMYCAKTSEDTLSFTFIRKPTVPTVDVTSTSSMEQDIDVPAKLEAAYIYHVAALTEAAFREDIADALMAISQRYLDQNATNTEQ